MDTNIDFDKYWDWIAVKIDEMLPNIVVAILILIVGLWISKFLNRMVRKFFEIKDYDPTLESFLQSFIRIALKVVLFVLVVTQLGVQSSTLVAIVGSAGLAIGLALQGSLANFAGGVLILLFKPFKVGDYISAGGLDGTVKEISIFTTKLNTFGNQVAIIPNGKLSNDSIINYNVENIRRNRITIGIGYTSNIKQAKDILLKVCTDKTAILQEPAPEVFVGNLADSAVELSLRYWTKNEDYTVTHSAVLEELKACFDANEIEIPFPQTVVHKVS